jgi:hypothetical protein
MTGVHQHAQLLLVEVGFPELFWPEWPWTVILPISASLVAWIIDISHHAQPKIVNEIIQYEFLLLNIIILRFVHIVAYINNLFLLFCFAF